MLEDSRQREMKMLIHGKINSSSANGPGNRAVLHVQGCTLACPGCWNPESHAFDTKTEVDRWTVVDWILGLEDVEGLTLSGGEPMQQAPQILLLMQAVLKAKPGFSIGMYTGYTKKELENGRFKWKSAYDAEWQGGSTQLWHEIRSHLDFAVVGRYVQSMACHDEPLRGSRNQEVLFFTDRYAVGDLAGQIAEVSIGEDALVQITGYPTVEFLEAVSKTSISNQPMSKVPVPCNNDDDDGLICV